MKKIAVEEAFVTAEIAAEWTKVLARSDVEPGFAKMGESILADTPGNALLHGRLVDIGKGRIAHMDEVGVDMQVLSLTSPGVQVFAPDLAVRLAADANDALAEAVRAAPTRLAGLGAIAPQDPPAAAREIERIKSLGLRGLIVNSHTFGEYLDAPRYVPIFEAMEATGLPMYLHPREPAPGMVQPFLDYGLYFAGWGFAAETGLHAMRLIMSGSFARHPKLKIILGHMGEGIPFWLQRIDNRYLLQVKIGAVEKLPRLPSEYFLDNFVITTAGVTSMPALRLSIDVLGAERILFAADFPYEDDAEALRFLEGAALTQRERELIAYQNAERLFALS
ncbi:MULTISPECIES: amidohydrolase family protein [unclassified Bradyrhizobium]|uniref:amidohydrolase family protein n=1 Tax=unclassified Bradyrhizobium TaxID=2631580 RepID=UPI0028E3AC7E|nr:MULTISPECIES: amidohydrolase family protein [unclassified Bradyrhizobium]